MTKNQNLYVPVLKKLMDDTSMKTKNGFKMLKANYRAEGQKITAGKLAEAAGYDNYNTGNEQYGSFAHKISALIGFEPKQRSDGRSIWTFTICDAGEEKDKHGHFQWILKKEVSDALEAIGLVKQITNYDVFEDIKGKEEELQKEPKKSRDAVIKARIGQGLFRERLVNHWEGCAVTNCQNTDFLIASHIKPWRDCNPHEAIDMANGLLLIPNIDRVFDKGFISFESNGEIIISPQLNDKDSQVLGISKSMKLRWCYSQHNHFFEFHRKNVFRNDN